MTPEFKKLAERRAEEYRAEQREMVTELGAMISAEVATEWSKDDFFYGALDPVLEEARRAMYRAEAFEETIGFCRAKYEKLRAEKTSEFGDGVAGAYAETISDLRVQARAEREKLKKILSGEK